VDRGLALRLIFPTYQRQYIVLRDSHVLSVRTLQLKELLLQVPNVFYIFSHLLETFLLGSWVFERFGILLKVIVLDVFMVYRDPIFLKCRLRSLD
jgi:hypothetical protein